MTAKHCSWWLTTLGSTCLGLAITSFGMAQETLVEPTATDQVAESPSDAESAEAAVLFPLRVGSSWTYAPQGGGPITVERIVEKREFDGRTWYRLRGGDPEADTAAAAAAEGEDATAPAPPAAGDAEDAIEEEPWELWITNLEGGQADADLVQEDPSVPAKIDFARLYYRYPVKAGQTYRIVEGEPTQMMVMAVDQPVTTPAGEFKCIVYKEVDPTNFGFVFTSFVAPGVGPVMTQTLDNGELSTDVLMKYHLPKEEE